MYKPTIDTYLTIDLPGEKLRAVVRKILTPNKVVIELTGCPLAKSHQYKKDDFVACKRTQGIFGETWEAIESKPNLEDFVEKIDAKHTRRTNVKRG